VIHQALHRQPNTAAQYLQQMYAAQQQHLMLQTAALQQQHNLSTNGTTSQQAASSQTTINLNTSHTTAQLISRAQSVSSAPASISQQAVLLGSPSSPTTLTASQAQMYLRAQMVARSLGRAVPLSSQLIFTPTATVTAVQSEGSVQQQAASCQNQVQNLAIRGQQGASTGSSQSHAPQALSLKQTPVPIQPATLIRNPCPQSVGVGAMGKGPGHADGPSEAGKKAEPEVRAINMSRNHNSSAGAPPLIAPAYTQIQPHSLQNAQSSHRPQGQLLQTASIQPCQHPVPVLPKPGPHPTSGHHQATIFHNTLTPQALNASLSHAKAQPVQLTAINLQIQPTASRMIQDCKDKPTSKPIEQQPKASLPAPPVGPPQGKEPASSGLERAKVTLLEDEERERLSGRQSYVLMA
ncbi:hypothetical protein NHX12_029805, partial [Muraenolepis orangiensis]